jgi:hypothetical protein
MENPLFYLLGVEGADKGMGAACTQPLAVIQTWPIHHRDEP